jgi:hypothetical protein
MRPPKLERAAGGWSLLLRFGNGQRGRFVLPLATETEAQRRSAQLTELAAQLAKAGLHVEAPVILWKGAEQPTAAGFAEVEAFALDLCAKSGSAAATRPESMTFRELGERWTSGEPDPRYPDHVELKRTAETDERRLQKLYAVVGGVPLAAFGLNDAEAAMAALPPDIVPGTRRHYAQLMAKVLKLAVYPCKVIGQSPLPAGFLPKTGQKKAKAYLLPKRGRSASRQPGRAAVLSTSIRVLGARGHALRRGDASDVGGLRSEARIGHPGHEQDGRPRAWALSAGVARALAEHRPDDAGDDGRVFARAMSDSRRSSSGRT